ncbi:hypothetical protein CEB3_c48990 [Peptococcaceae bacterium CEB3]|nr:hypothetical protein CEB3_c48990 [Peptococcaceae bacterium CEB3]
MKFGPSTMLITGQAKPSKEDVISVVYESFFVSLIVDGETDIILDVTCNTIRDMTTDFIRSLIVGQNLITGIDDILRDIRCRFFGLVQKPLVVALKDAHNRYVMIKKKGIKGDF